MLRFIHISPHQLLTRRITSSVSYSIPSNSEKVPVSRDDLLDDAAYLTKSLYRRCLRSLKVIRWGNSFDDKEFEKRENEFQNPTAGSRISMSPPPNKDDELKSRAEYYHSYAREYFTQESDSLDNEPLNDRDIRRYLYYLRKGEKDRRWLLGDMMFSDPYKDSIDQKRINKFESMSRKYLGEDEEEEDNSTVDNHKNGVISKGSNDGFMDDDDPDWFQKEYGHLR